MVNSSPPPLGKVDPDFNNTQNMLSLLSKADLKIKTAAAAAQQESRYLSYSIFKSKLILK